jgi:predicted DNA-binding transcriptional regulator AlpA
MNAPVKTHEIDPLLHPVQVAKLLGVSPSWLAKSRLNGTGPRFIKIGRAVRYALSGRHHKVSELQLHFPKETRIPKRKDTTCMPPSWLPWAYWEHAPHVARRLRSD